MATVPLRRVFKDQYLTNFYATDTLKIPQYRGFAHPPGQGEVDNTPGMRGNIILDRSTGLLCWHNGVTWKCAQPVGDNVTLVNGQCSPAGVDLVVGPGPHYIIRGLQEGPGVSLAVNGECVEISADVASLTFGNCPDGVNILGGTPPNYVIKGLIAGDEGISFVDSSDCITVNTNIRLVDAAGQCDPGTNVSLFTNAFPNYLIKGLHQGAGIVLSDSGSCITIDAVVGSLTSLTCANSVPVLTGASPNYNIRSIVAGNAGISVGATANCVQINNEITVNNSELCGVAPTAAYLVAGTYPNYVIKGLVAGPGVTLADDDCCCVTISSVLTIENDNCDNGVALLRGTAPNYFIRGLFAADAGITIDADGPCVDIGTAIRLLDGSAVCPPSFSLVQDNFPNYTINGLKEGPGVTMSQDNVTKCITIAADVASLSSGDCDVSLLGGVAPDYVIKGLNAGNAGVSLSSSADCVTINNEITVEAAPLCVPNGGVDLLVDNYPNYIVKGLVPTAGVHLTDSGGCIAIGVDIPTLTSLTCANGVPVLTGAAPNYNIRSIVAGNAGITIGATANCVQINNAITVSNSELCGVAPTAAYLVAGTYPNYVVKGLLAGSNITLADDDCCCVTISAALTTLTNNNCSPAGINLITGAAPNYNVRGLRAGSGIELDVNGGCIDISSNGIGGPLEFIQETYGADTLSNLRGNNSTPYTQNGVTSNNQENFLYGSDFVNSTGTSPTSGAGFNSTRMYFIGSGQALPSFGSFRAGIAAGTQWDLANAGRASAAFGESTIASGSRATAFGFGNTASGNNSTVAGASSQAVGNNSFAVGNSVTASGTNSAVLGGNGNNVAVGATNAAAVGGVNNQTDSFESIVLGGSNHVINASPNAAVVGGDSNNVGSASNYAGIFTGRNNDLNNASQSSILGGANNAIGSASPASTVNYSVIAGGRANTLGNGNYMAIGGGQNNAVDNSDWANIAGGQGNTIQDSDWAAILGGQNNTIDPSDGAVLVGGKGNTITDSDYSAIVAGQTNTMSNNSLESTMLGGLQNTMNAGIRSLMSGGTLNTITASGNASIIGGTLHNISNTAFAGIFHGYQNTIFSTNGIETIVGGQQNQITGGSTAVNLIAGGTQNSITSGIGSSTNDAIVGGQSNNVNGGSQNVIVGGLSNIIVNSNVTVNNSGILAGQENQIDGSPQSGTVAGSKNSISDGGFSVIAGGILNQIGGLGQRSFVAGGQNNQLYVGASAIIAGKDNIVIGNTSSIYNAIVAGHNSGIGTDNQSTIVDTIIAGCRDAFIDNSFVAGQMASYVCNITNGVDFYPSQNEAANCNVVFSSVRSNVDQSGGAAIVSSNTVEIKPGIISPPNPPQGCSIVSSSADIGDEFTTPTQITDSNYCSIVDSISTKIQNGSNYSAAIGTRNCTIDNCTNCVLMASEDITLINRDNTLQHNSNICTGFRYERGFNIDTLDPGDLVISVGESNRIFYFIIEADADPMDNYYIDLPNIPANTGYGAHVTIKDFSKVADSNFPGLSTTTNVYLRAINNPSQKIYDIGSSSADNTLLLGKTPGGSVELHFFKDAGNIYAPDGVWCVLNNTT